MTAILSVKGAVKTFGAVEALRGVDLRIAPGEIHAVCGDNGAGKSTLIKLVSGVEQPDAGTIRLRGEPIAFASPHQALEAGIATIYQDLGLAPRMTIYQNIFMGSELERRLLGLKYLDKLAMREESRAWLDRLGIDVTSVDTPVENLSGGQRQAVAICRALRWNAEVIIMDEPTAALGVRETEHVLDLIRMLKQQGTTVVVVSHNMTHVAALADRATILRSGRTQTELSLDGVTPETLSRLILSGAAA
ncbi:MAG: ATP-binding cassette domain-containing protein [Thiotrichales bacterium]|nr:ATP-binding cassette domain-containing protein [Thiotrichales bacterium]MCY4284730.1 ATP-binding cassette domain-containing protein [Thiotrichales bacterium]MCY4350356.1 ATP-binding cassette domain-containing protein [Thiotrichales bacterium]